MHIALDGRTVRTPEEHRAAVAETRSEWPVDDLHYWHIAVANDAKPVKRRPSKAPRHRAIARELAGLRTWIAMKSDTPETAWLVGDNDNHPDSAMAPAWSSRQAEAKHDILPTEDQMLAAVAGACPVSDGEYTVLGGLRFIGDRLVGWRKTPAGPWRKPTEIYERRHGTTAGTRSGNQTIRAIMKMQGDWEAERSERDAYVAPCSGGPVGEHGAAPWRCAGYDDGDRSSRAADRELLGRLDIAGTTIAYGPSPALPSDKRLADAFSAFKVSGGGRSPIATYGPQETAMIRRQDQAAASRLNGDDAGILDAAITSRTMADIGKMLGFNGKNAEKQGKLALVQSAGRLHEMMLAA